MNKRDYFAAQAMQALISKLPLILSDGEGENEEQTAKLYKLISVSAYKYASAMLEEHEDWN